jgi:DNA ligase (NAD+)
MEVNIEYLKENYIEYAKETPIKDLVKLLNKLKDIYYNQSELNQSVPDIVFDSMEEILKKRSPNNKYFDTVGAPIINKIKVKLPSRMPSLDKFKDEKSINRYVNKYPGVKILSDKLDGVSALFYQDKLYTRGDGEYGTDISNYIKELKLKLPSELMIRGELIIPKKFHDKFETSPRNIVSGYLNSKNIDKSLSKYIEFVAYQIIDSELTPEEQFKIMKEMKINSVFNSKKQSIKFEQLSEYLKERKINSKYDIDGIVIYDNQEYTIPKSRNPKNAFAFKMDFDNQIAKTEVLEVEYNVSKDGRLIPRLLIKPVKVGGVTISKVTGHNAKFIIENKINQGTILEIIRSGDVIPKVHNIIKNSKTGKLPEIEHHWNSTGVHLILNNSDDNIDMLSKNILHFITKMKIANVNIGLVNRFIEFGLDTLEKILNSKEDDFLKIEGIKSTMASKIYKNIQNGIKDVELYKVMNASNMFGSGLGERKLKLITDAYPDILKINNNLFDKIVQIDGFSNITTNKFIDNLESFKQFLKIHKNIKIKEKSNKSPKTGNKYKNEIIVFSGFRNDELKLEIENNGGKVGSSVSSNTTKVIVKNFDNTSSKVKKAQELNIPVILLKKFL